jgi:hypothetical protein
LIDINIIYMVRSELDDGWMLVWWYRLSWLIGLNDRMLIWLDGCDLECHWGKEWEYDYDRDHNWE